MDENGCITKYEMEAFFDSIMIYLEGQNKSQQSKTYKQHSLNSKYTISASSVSNSKDSSLQDSITNDYPQKFDDIQTNKSCT